MHTNTDTIPTYVPNDFKFTYLFDVDFRQTLYSRELENVFFQLQTYEFTKNA